MKKSTIIQSKTVLLLCMLFLNQIGFAQKTLSFRSSVVYGSQENNLAVLVSTDFDGAHTMESIQKATWTDITKEASLASDKEWAESGEVDLSKWVKDRQPAYVAFRYLGQESAKPNQRGWGVSNVAVGGKRISIKDFAIVDADGNKEGATWVPSSTMMRFRSNLSKVKSESWAIAKVTE